MHLTTKFYYLLKNVKIAWLLVSFPATAAFAAVAAEPSGPVVVTIKPLYSLVAHLSEGIETPLLLMKQMQSPHHYNMKPSERALLAKAKMIIWTGPPMESFLDKILQQQKKTTVIVTAMQAKNLILLARRGKHSHHEEKPLAGHKTEAHSIDPHVWLSENNAIAISHLIAESLITSDPENTGLYENNLQKLVAKISETKDLIDSALQNRHSPFIAFHDAFQYFENEHQLNYVASISFDEETGAGLKHLRYIRKEIENNNIHCLVYQAPKPAIVDSLTRQTSIKTVALDPLGLEVTNDKNAWFEIMQQMSIDFNACLNP